MAISQSRTTPCPMNEGLPHPATGFHAPTYRKASDDTRYAHDCTKRTDERGCNESPSPTLYPLAVSLLIALSACAQQPPGGGDAPTAADDRHSRQSVVAKLPPAPSIEESRASTLRPHSGDETNLAWKRFQEAAPNFAIGDVKCEETARLAKTAWEKKQICVGRLLAQMYRFGYCVHRDNEEATRWSFAARTCPRP